MSIQCKLAGLLELLLAFAAATAGNLDDTQATQLILASKCLWLCSLTMSGKSFFQRDKGKLLTDRLVMFKSSFFSNSSA